MLTVRYTCERCDAKYVKVYQNPYDIIPDIEDQSFMYNDKYICEDCRTEFDALRNNLRDYRINKLEEFWGGNNVA